MNSKAVIYGANGEVNATKLQISGNDITATAAEINILDNMTSTTAELNLLTGVTGATVSNDKAVIYGSSGEVNATKLQVGGVDITATPTQINKLAGVTSTANELNLVSGASAGNINNSKAVIYGTNGEVNAKTLKLERFSNCRS